MRFVRHPPQYKTIDGKALPAAGAREAESELDHVEFVSRLAAECTTLAEALYRYKTEITNRKACPTQDHQRTMHWTRQLIAPHLR